MLESNKIVISIVSWNYLKKAEELVESLIPQINQLDSIVVIETGRKNDSIKKNQTKNKQVEIILSNQNLGYAASHEISINKMLSIKATGILILNPDVSLNNNNIFELKQVISKSKNESIISGPVYNLIDGQISKEYFGYPVKRDIIDSLMNVKIQNGNLVVESHNTYSVKDMHGCYLYIPAHIIVKYGWMDKKYFLYGEENEYLHRIRHHKINLIVSTSLPILHENGGTFSMNNDLKNVREYYQVRNRHYNSYIFFGIRAFYKINYIFIIKYFLGRYFFRFNKFRQNDINYFNFIGIIHFLKGIRGKTFDPNDYDQQ